MAANSEVQTAPRIMLREVGEETYNAYCMTPFFPSWLGNGTSRFSLPVTLVGGCVPCTLYSDGTADAGFGAEDEIAATDRYGIMAELGLAVVGTSLAVVASTGSFCCMIERTS